MHRSAAVGRPGISTDGTERPLGGRGPLATLTTVAARRRAGRAPVFALLLACALGLAAGVGVPSAAGAPAVVRSAEPSSSIPRQQVVRLVLRADSTQEYLLYVPSRGGAGAPLFVAAHGISRNAEEHATLFAPFAEKRGVVLVAPYFDREGHDDYQRLGREGRGRRADHTLDSILDEVRSLTGAREGKVLLFGFSGGAQFAHRYAMLHPDRVERAVVTSAGWYTFPDSGTAYPYGIAPTPELEGARFDPRAFLRVPIRVLVGGADTGSTNLRQNAFVDRQQGRTRVERARNWAAAMRRAAEARGQVPVVTYEQVPGIRHSFRQFMLEGGLGDKVFAALFEPSLSLAPQPEGTARVPQGAGANHAP